MYRPTWSTKRRAALEVAEIVRTLDADDDVVLAALLQPLLEEELIDREAACDARRRRSGAPCARALSELGEFGLPADWTPERGLEPAQAEALRKMLSPSSATCGWWS